ncbi:hypothetical protein OU426_06260 [Frigidibacter sp. RF13]|uniref:hypothetical protein n=1 Tax=Frigidibacter sp. RF13 TaxID=2997340 RepID=UPI00226FEFBF|nr:hypothetical protein [Frigidibacter sp. RF13]MCY1126455.1 hypothetical protein [Frigidibacter sp. RF13]
MKGWQIFIHSVRQVFGNLEAALKVSGPLYLIQLAVAVFIGVNVFSAIDFSAQGARLPVGPLLIVILVTSVVGVWIAVAWHRFILRVERPSSLLPAFNGDRMMAYFGRSFLIALLVIPAAVAIGFVAALLAYAFQPFGESTMELVARVLFVVPLVFLVLRLSVSLPAAALGESSGIGDGWRATIGQAADLLALSVILVVFGSLLALPGKLFLPPGGLVPAIWAALIGWVQMMVWASVLTTLYGHYIEGRALS